jgi:integrase
MKQIRMDCASKPSTISFNESKTNQLLKSSLAGSQIDRIGEREIETFKRSRTQTASRRKRPLSPASVNRELATLRRLLRMAHDWKHIDRVPRIKLLHGEKTREFVLARTLEAKYLGALREPLRSVATLLLDTGLRIGEVLKPDWTDVNLRDDPGYLRVRGPHSKNHKPRTVPLTQRALAVLTANRERSGLVFTVKGEPLYQTWLNQQHTAARELLGLPEDFVLHSLRHTFGTRLGETGADAFTIMKLMGHSSVAVSQRYVHPSTETMKLAIERLGAVGVPPKSPTVLTVLKRKRR